MSLKESDEKFASEHVESSMKDEEEGQRTPILQHTEEEERRFVKRLDRRVLPWVMLLYMLSYMDRSVLGNSVALGIKQDLHLVGSQYEWAGALFYCATFLFGTIGGLMLKIVKPRYYLAACCIGWGGMAAVQAAATDFASLGAIRFFLGLFEASFAPGCAFYLSFWYTKNELTLRIAAYTGTSALAGVLGGLISYGFGFASKYPLKQWQWLFIAEGIPTIVFGILTPFMLPDRPETAQASWMSDAEHMIALDRRNRYVQNSAQSGIQWGQVKEALFDYRLWLFAVIYSGLSLSLAVISIFLPSLLSVMGFSGYQSNLMTVPPYAVGYFGLLSVAWASDRFRQRAIPVSLAAAIGGIGYLLIGLVAVPAVRYFGAFLVVAGTYWSFPVVLAWITNTFAADSKAATGLGAVIAVTHAVGIAAAHIYPADQAPQYRLGSIVSAALMFAATIGALVMRYLLQRENMRRDGLTGPGAEPQQLELDDSADKNINYRYVL